MHQTSYSPSIKVSLLNLGSTSINSPGINNEIHPHVDSLQITCQNSVTNRHLAVLLETETLSRECGKMK